MKTRHDWTAAVSVGEFRRLTNALEPSQSVSGRAAVPGDTASRLICGDMTIDEVITILGHESVPLRPVSALTRPSAATAAPRQCRRAAIDPVYMSRRIRKFRTDKLYT